MPRTTPARVGTLVALDETSWPDLDTHIQSANVLVTKVCVSAADPLDDAHLALVETWLAAHFYAVTDPQSTYEQAGSVSIKYEGTVDLNLNLTRFGQQAMLLDTTGGLAFWNKRMLTGMTGKARFQWLGTPKCDGRLP